MDKQRENEIQNEAFAIATAIDDLLKGHDAVSSIVGIAILLAGFAKETDKDINELLDHVRDVALSSFKLMEREPEEMH